MVSTFLSTGVKRVKYQTTKKAYAFTPETSKFGMFVDIQYMSTCAKPRRRVPEASRRGRRLSFEVYASVKPQYYELL